MNTRLIGAATLFTAGSLLSAGTTTLGAKAVEPAGGNAQLALAGCGSSGCGSSDAKTDDKAKDMKKGKKDGSCGKDHKKDGSCGKDHKKGDAKDKKAEPEKK